MCTHIQIPGDIGPEPDWGDSRSGEADLDADGRRRFWAENGTDWRGGWWRMAFADPTRRAVQSRQQ